MQSNSAAQIFEWAYQHSGIITVPLLVGLVWKASRMFTEATTIATHAVGQINKMADEHFPAMTASLRTQDGYLKKLVDSQMQFATAQPIRRKRKN